MEFTDSIVEKSYTCLETATLQEAAFMFSNKKVESLPILDKNRRVLGIVTQKSLAHAILSGASLHTPVTNFREKAVLATEIRTHELVEHPLDRIVIVDGNNHYLGIISPAQLLTSVVQREQMITELNLVLDSSNNCVIAINREGKVVVYNKAAEKILKMPAHQALGKPIYEICPRTPLSNILKSGDPIYGKKFEYRGAIYISNRTPIIRSGDMVGAVTIFQDVTEMQQVLVELNTMKEYKTRLEDVVNSPYNAIAVIDIKGIITMLNKTYADFLGITSEEAVGKHVTQVIENTRLHTVIKTGEAEMGAVQKVRGRDIVVMRLPIERNGRIVGAMEKVLFKDYKELTSLAIKISSLENEINYYKDAVKKYQGITFSIDDIIAQSSLIEGVKQTVRKVAQSNSTVLIRGESGTGKELFASAIHYESGRKAGPFIKVNCAAIPDNLLESELFGYHEGAFTGAMKGGRKGKFELADNGTIFLDEIGDMPLPMQAKLLRVLQEREIERVGGQKPIKVNVRVLAATNRSLEELMEKKLFRPDLYFRLNVVEIKIPPLRYRKEDIPLLVEYLLKKLCNAMGRPLLPVSKETMNCLLNYDWPGNIRELENVIERCLNLVEGKEIAPAHLPIHIKHPVHHEDLSSGSLKKLLDDTERTAIVNAIADCGGDKIKAALTLGISRASIYQKIDKLNIR